VLRTRGIHPELGNRLEAASGYRHVYAQGDPRNPQIRSHTIVQTPVGQMCVLSRIIDAGNDYSGRSNKLAHHLAFDAADVAARAKSSPAAVLLAAERSGIFQRQWAGEPREQPAAPAAPNVPVEPGPCAAWARAAGDAGWAGFLVDRALKKEPTWIIAPPGVDLVELYAEALALVNYPQRWSISFTTYALTAGDALWLGTVDGSPEAQSARGQQRIAVVDLVRRPALTVQSPTIDAARGTGQVPWKRDMSRPAAAASVAPAAVTSAGLAPGQQVGPAIPVTGPVTLPPAIGGASGGPPRLGGPLGSPPPIENKNPLGGPPLGGPWGTGAGDDFPSEPARGGGLGIKVLAAVGAGVLVAGLGALVWFKPELGQWQVALGRGEKQAKEPVKPEKDGPRQPAPPSPVSSERAGQPSDGNSSASPEPPAQAVDVPNPGADSTARPIEDKPATAPPAPPRPTPAEKWKAFQAERAKPGGRYPLESLDGEKPELQVARICKVDDVEFDLIVPTTAFTDIDDVWQLACSRPDKTKQKWEFECLSWKESERRANSSAPIDKTKIASATVDDEGWLVVTLDPLDEKQPIAKLAREALACAPLTFKTPLHPNSGYDMAMTFVQLRRPAEYGPIVIKSFFGNKQLWQRPHEGTSTLTELREVTVPPNPWNVLLTPIGSGTVLLGSKVAPALAVKLNPVIPTNPGSFQTGKSYRPCELQLNWFALLKCGQHSFAQTNLLFGLGDDVRKLAVGISAPSPLEAEIAKYSRLAPLNRVTDQVHREKIGSDVMRSDQVFPIDQDFLKNLKTQFEKVKKPQAYRIVQSCLEIELFETSAARVNAIKPIFKSEQLADADDWVLTLLGWKEPFTKYVVNHPEYKAWCGIIPPKPDPGDKKKYADWEASRDLVQRKLGGDPHHVRQFKEDKLKACVDRAERLKVEPLMAVCRAIERLPTLDAEKRETLDLLESLMDADLQITGSLVVWENNYQEKQCVLATFTAGRDPVVIEPEKADDKSKTINKNK